MHEKMKKDIYFFSPPFISALLPLKFIIFKIDYSNNYIDLFYSKRLIKSFISKIFVRIKQKTFIFSSTFNLSLYIAN